MTSLQNKIAINIILGTISFLLLAYLLSPLAAITVIGLISFHEYCHILAAKKLGCETHGMFFLPMIGMVALIDDFEDHNKEALIALAGPAGGLLLATAVCILGLIMHSPVILFIASICALINLVNILPINPLDGGRILKCIAFSMGKFFGYIALIFGALLGIYLFFGTVNFIIGLITICAIVSIFNTSGYLNAPRMNGFQVTRTIIAFAAIWIWGFLVMGPGFSLGKTYDKKTDEQVQKLVLGKSFIENNEENNTKKDTTKK